jgi:hypothetical protein
MTDVPKDTDDRRIYWIGGCKGGVGKSMMTSATIDYLLDRGQSVVLAESDTSNPDVSKAYESLLPAEVVNLDRRTGWVDLVNICDANPQAAIVVNTAARNNESVRMYGNPFTSDVRRGIAPGARSWLGADVCWTRSCAQRGSAGVIASIGRVFGSPGVELGMPAATHAQCSERRSADTHAD